MNDVRTDRRALTTEAYASDANLAARQSIYRYVDPPVDFHAWTLDHVVWEGVERVVDVGCGNGAYFPGLRRRIDPDGTVVGFDLSEGMLRTARHDGARLAVADAQALPLPDDVVDVVLAMHMLYHVPDVELALRELRRVLRPGGALLVATNGRDHQRELNDEFRRATGVSGDELLRVSAVRFSLENGEALLRTAFDDVLLAELPRTLVVPETEPLVAYVNSSRSWREHLLPPELTWAECLERIREAVGAEIARSGAFRVTVHPCVFVCR